MKVFLFLFGLALGLTARTAAGGDLTLQSRPGQRARLVELYTSEGCSSCPPADAWLGRLTASPQLWTEVVPVAFHVDYWDRLGWRDRFAAPAWTARQRTYAAAWGSDSVYTPGFVLDGREWRGWSGATVPASNAAGAGQLTAVVRNGKTVTILYRPASPAGGGAAAAREVSLAWLGCGLESNVKAGENRGRALRHDFVALACETKKLFPGQPEERAEFDLPAPTTDAGRLALAVWVQTTGQAGVLQAVGGWLDGRPAKP